MKPVRLTFKTQPQHGEWSDLERCWRTMDETPEFSGGWLFDHFYPIQEERVDGPCFEGWMALAYLAGVTRRITLGLMVSGNTYRHPAVLANMCATLDVASRGRLQIGLGAAWNQPEHDAYGIELPPLKTRMDMFEEACHVVDSLLTETTTTFHGEHYRLTDAYCEPKPVQEPRPPLVIGGNGEKRTLRIAARFADHWNFPGREPDELRHKLDILHRHCAEVGRDPIEIDVSAHLFEPLDRVASVEQARGLRAAGCNEFILYAKAPYRIEPLQEVGRALLDALA